MAKEMKRLELVGRLPNDTKANTHQAADVVYFSCEDGSIMARVVMDGKAVILKTKKGQYRLDKHASQNYYSGTLNKVKVQLTLKKVEGEMRWWE